MVDRYRAYQHGYLPGSMGLLIWPAFVTHVFLSLLYEGAAQLELASQSIALKYAGWTAYALLLIAGIKEFHETFILNVGFAQGPWV
jgi:hypothetical protein